MTQEQIQQYMTIILLAIVLTAFVCIILEFITKDK
jgi:hypothetical protein